MANGHSAPATAPLPFEVGGFVLAGGRSSRMGRNKALLELHGEPLIARALRTLREVCAEVAIAGGTDALQSYGRVIPDEHPDCGPLGGIVAALTQSAFAWNLFLPVDAPFIPASALRELLAAAATCPGIGVMARTGGRLQPLCAVYARRAAPALQQELAAGRWKVAEALHAAGEVTLVDFPDPSPFANLNTPEDFAAASSTDNQLTAATPGS